MISLLSRVDKHTVLVNFNLFTPEFFANRHDIVEIFLCACNQNKIFELSKYHWVIHCRTEGHGPQHIKMFIDRLSERNIHINYRVIFASIVDTEKLDYPSFVNPLSLINPNKLIDYCVYQKIDWENLEVDKKFICLMRRISYTRHCLALSIVKKFDKSDYRMSFGVNLDQSDKKFIGYQIPGVTLPLTLDFSYVPNRFAHMTNDDLFYKNYIHLVVESSHETNSFTEGWQDKFITEKTWKTFLWHQFPLWHAVRGTVNEIRKFGFDVFDDLFEDHRYDQIEDTAERMAVLLDILGKISQKDLKLLRQKHWHRLANNYKLLIDLKNLSQYKNSENLFLQTI